MSIDKIVKSQNNLLLMFCETRSIVLFVLSTILLSLSSFSQSSISNVDFIVDEEQPDEVLTKGTLVIDLEDVDTSKVEEIVIVIYDKLTNSLLSKSTFRRLDLEELQAYVEAGIFLNLLDLSLPEEIRLEILMRNIKGGNYPRIILELSLNINFN